MFIGLCEWKSRAFIGSRMKSGRLAVLGGLQGVLVFGGLLSNWCFLYVFDISGVVVPYEHIITALSSSRIHEDMPMCGISIGQVIYTQYLPYYASRLVPF
jgi:hypothetical protein